MTLGGHADSSANFAKGIRDRGNDADPALAAVAKFESRGRGWPRSRDRLERKLAVDRLDDVAARDHAVHRPDAVGIERHELDEADLISLATRELREVQDLVVVAPSHHDNVELDRAEPGIARRRQAAEHPIERIAAGEVDEPIPSPGVPADVETLEPRPPPPLRLFFQEGALRRHPGVDGGVERPAPGR